MGELLNPSIIDSFRAAINCTPIFTDDEKYKIHYNLCCAVMDRLDSSICYINSHQTAPETEESLLVFMMFSCMVVDAVRQVFSELGIKDKYPYESGEDAYRYFRNICRCRPLYIEDKDCPTDDKFFEYLRSIAFAHPFETSRPKFFQKGEIQYSPWVIANSRVMAVFGIEDGIGVRIYSNRFHDIQNLIFSFRTLNGYIQSRYHLIEEATAEINRIISDVEAKWRNDTVDQTLTPLDTLKDIKRILITRHESTYYIDTAISYIDCDLTVPENTINVTRFVDAIKTIIPDLCIAVNALDSEKTDTILRKVLLASPRFPHSLANYQLEKIYGYLNEDEGSSNIQWGRQQAEEFFNEFAHKWVTIKPSVMNFTEIKLLVAAACFLEWEDQKNSIKK